ncbi:MAG: hypothetical protein Ct9H300mP1_27070 [Planctomycetaceae bacterium]|nr:MAG: hypothetical protein Ct9H300mP1_27070 [Planctomycetaceae bacterium]
MPADVGDAGHDLLLRELKGRLPELEAKMVGMGAPGFFLEVEPHLKGGGQFGGFSGPDGKRCFRPQPLPGAGLRRHRLRPEGLLGYPAGTGFLVVGTVGLRAEGVSGERRR